MERKESRHRHSAAPENLALFEQLLRGLPAAQSHCLRAKIDMASLNGTLRDPVLYRHTPSLNTHSLTDTHTHI